jgi:glycosyltransferase involved in cell wall biosynthesis
MSTYEHVGKVTLRLPYPPKTGNSVIPANPGSESGADAGVRSRDTRDCFSRNDGGSGSRPNHELHAELSPHEPVKRILLVGPVPPPEGGIASYIEDMMHSDLSKHYAFELFPRSEGFPPGADGLLGRNLFRIKRFARFFDRAARGRFDLIHLHSADILIWGTTLFLLIARLARAKVLLHVHGTDWNTFYNTVSSWRRWVTRRALSLPTMIVVLYPLWEENIRKLGIRTDVRCVRNFIIPPPLLEQDAVERTRKSLGLDKTHFVVLTVGSVGKRKGVFELLKAVPQVVSQDDSIRFILAGGQELPGEMAQVRDIIREGNMDKCVKLLGEVKREEVPRLLGLADVFLLPSLSEGMPLAILEAIGYKVPVISTTVGGIPEAVTNEVSGLLIHPGAPDEIAWAVLKLRRDPELRERLAQRAIEIFDERFAFSRGIGEIESLYSALV